MVGAWAASKWMIPWADEVGEVTSAGYKGVTQGWWALGAVLGSFFGAQIAAWLGRRRAYVLISLGATALTLTLFLGTAPLKPSFLPIVFAQGFVATLFFGWLPLYLPELFPTHVRAAGSGIAYNVGRFATGEGVLAAGILFRPSAVRTRPSAPPRADLRLRPDRHLLGTRHDRAATGGLVAAQYSKDLLSEA